ncbi:4446_t:CDS:2 [Racocetra fulgida]|uniref:4446_t:CDS:1 n=1 Tax=Racocetra fulgida TaxID=60492 RepID=A0A9N9FAA2_9GLOM|nr:4446_t:CDS:2 [Racocetra fulgida]
MLFDSRPRFISFVTIIIAFFIGFFFLAQQLIQQDDLVKVGGNWLKEKFEAYLLDNKLGHGSWTKILSHQDFPDYQIRLKEPKLCDASVQQLIPYYHYDSPGNDAWTKELDWSGKQGFNDAKTRPWKVKGDKSVYAGEARTYKGLTFLRVFEAGHMVPYDQPRST